MKNDFSSIDVGEDFMAHYGILGMHWGIRNDGLSEEDRKWKKSGVSKAERKAAVNAAKEDFSKAIVEVNAKPEHQSIPMDQYGAESGFEPPSVRKYYDEVLTVAQRSFDKASLRFPPSPSGKLRFRLVANSPYGWTGTTALDDHVFWDLEVVDSSVLEHSVSGEFLSHFGVKGMHWGIRKSGKVTGLDRSTGALIDQNSREIVRARKQLNDRGVSTYLGRRFFGNAEYNKLKRSRIASLTNENDRMRKGWRFYADRKKKLLNLSLWELYISATPDPSLSNLSLPQHD